MHSTLAPHILENTLPDVKLSDEKGDEMSAHDEDAVKLADALLNQIRGVTRLAKATVHALNEGINDKKQPASTKEERKDVTSE